MKVKSKISIIIPAYNAAVLISETLDSVLKQTYDNWECIVIDDGSTDRTQEIVKKYSEDDDRFKFQKRSNEPKGASTCRNIGINESRGEFIVFLDSDDLLGTNCIMNRIASIENTNFDFTVFNSAIFTNSLETEKNKTYSIIDVKKPLEAFLEYNLPWQICSVIWRKETLKKIGGFNEKFKRLQDPELHTRVLFNKETSFKTFPLAIPDCFIRRNFNIKTQNVSIENKLEGFINYLYQSSALIKTNNQLKYYDNLRKTFFIAFKGYAIVNGEFDYAIKILNIGYEEGIINISKMKVLRTYLDMTKRFYLWKIPGFGRFSDLIFFDL